MWCAVLPGYPDDTVKHSWEPALSQYVFLQWDFQYFMCELGVRLEKYITGQNKWVKYLQEMITSENNQQ